MRRSIASIAGFERRSSGCASALETDVMIMVIGPVAGPGKYEGAFRTRCETFSYHKAVERGSIKGVLLTHDPRRDNSIADERLIDNPECIRLIAYPASAGGNRVNTV